MTCERYRLLLQELLDGTLSSRLVREMAEHEASCPVCTAKRQEMTALLEDLRALNDLDEQTATPKSLSFVWRQAIRAEGSMEPTKRKNGHAMRSWRVWVALAAVAVVLFGGTTLYRVNIGEGRPGSTDEPPPTPIPTTIISEAAEKPKRLIARKGVFTIDTAHFDEDMATILQASANVDALVVYQSVSGESLQVNPSDNLYGYMTLRIPDAAFDEFAQTLTGIGRVKNHEITSDDYSSLYASNAALLERHNQEMERLEAYRTQTRTLEETLLLERQMADVQAKIASAESQLQSWNYQVQFSEVTISLTEVAEIATPESGALLPRMRTQFARSLNAVADYFKDMLVFLVIASPWILLVAMITAIALLVERFHWKSRQY